MKTGVILANLGTPTAPISSAIRQFLRAFLRDPRIIQGIPPWLWRIILESFVLPFRTAKVRGLYEKIWTDAGSPLLAYSLKQEKALNAALSSAEIPVAFAMTYGEPSFDNALNRLEGQGCERIVVLPLYPQYSSTTTAAVFDGLARAFRSKMVLPEIIFVRGYHRHPLYIQAIASSIEAHWQAQGRGELLLFSFHGLPVSYCMRGDPYSKACEETVAAVAAVLNLKKEEYALTYQSRFGAQPWLQPYTMEFLSQKARAGLKHVDVIAPGFAVDCLETLEELALQNKAAFLQSGGETFHYIPALNDSKEHIALLQTLVEARL